MPCWRKSAAVAPASCSFRMRTICSSVNRLLRTLSPLELLAPEDPHYPWTSVFGGGAGQASSGQVLQRALSILAQMIVNEFEPRL